MCVIYLVYCWIQQAVSMWCLSGKTDPCVYGRALICCNAYSIQSVYGVLWRYPTVVGISSPVDMTAYCVSSVDSQ